MVIEPRIGVAVVSYNTAGLLRRCLESIVADTDAPVLVVDNRSGDDSVELVRREFPGVQLRAEVDNRGYGAAANLALAEIRAKYTLLLNADTELTHGSITALADYLDAHPSVAVAGPRLVNVSGDFEPSAHPFPRPLALLLQESGLRRRLGLDRQGEWRARSVDWVLGAALAIRRDAFAAVKGFDESFFLYQEEVDLCYRLRAAGWEIHYAPVGTIRHVGGASTGQRAAETFAHFVRSTQRIAHLRWSRGTAIGVRGVLGGVLAARLARDAVQLTWSRDPERRERLLRRLAVWRQGLAALRTPG